ncbi:MULTISPECIES: FadR/GntR family transcriptional regulator [Marinobacter]|uniref:FadR/GntR family transcriptional regulator n=1 Tax=Marinobacter xiaoshiensis TaxID=3073652 RepID=A0ABU2HGZ5_9GAMM|nr:MULTISPECIES: FadR/GntR family transcriptional regulator [unclassified Marinobacter]MBK1874522.1 FadR family transcriptional regulator [Marinobacter sp. 1-3A]MBK1887846.1 FadR family transcriptional regulator [Marinobacter sp. DY40_1A1]MDS1310326.1 FadR/GntR family transcriptional regulator [Marinobacter sp. F60267]
MLKKIQKGSLVETAIESLRHAIETEQWLVGDKLPVEAELSEALGVSRNTVREAVRVLAHVGMLETRQGDGTYVRATRDAGETLKRIARTQLTDQLEVRIMLETEAAKLAAQRRTDQDVRAMTMALDARGKADSNLQERIRHDEAFHHALVAASHNSALSELYDYFSHAITQTIERTESDADLPEPSQEDHELLLAAVRRQDSDKAEKLARALLSPSLQALRKRGT